MYFYKQIQTELQNSKKYFKILKINISLSSSIQFSKQDLSNAQKKIRIAFLDR